MPTAHDEPARSTGHHPDPDPHVVIVPDDISSITGPHPDQPRRAQDPDRVAAALVETETAVPDSVDHPQPGAPRHRRRVVLVVLLLLAAAGALVAFPPPPSAQGQLLAIALLVLIFGISMWRDISMGVVAFPVAFVSGTLYFDVSTAEITKGFPGALVTTLIGVTYLFGVARTNGTIQQIVRTLVRLVHGKVLLLPWVFFMLAAAITASGALSLATYSILIPLGLSFARSHKVSPLVMGLSILNGTNAGGFSPIAIYWVIVNNVLVNNGIHVQPMPVFWWTFAVNVLLNIGACLLFSGRNGDRLHVNPTRTDEATVAEHAARAAQDQHWTGQQLLTMALFAAMVVGAIFYRLDVGFAALCIALVLAVIDPVSGKEGTKEIGWGVVLLIAGIVTFINMLETAGIVTLVANNVAHIGTPLLAALLMLVVAALTSAFASTNAMFVVLVPLAAPLLLTGRVELLGFVIALCLSASIVDSSPFSTAGALMLANTEQYLYDRTMKWLMTWAFSMIIIAPVTTWLVFLVL